MAPPGASPAELRERAARTKCATTKECYDALGPAPTGGKWVCDTTCAYSGGELKGPSQPADMSCSSAQDCYKKVSNPGSDAIWLCDQGQCARRPAQAPK